MSVSFAKISNFLSEDTGRLLKTEHPCVLIKNNDGTCVAFAYTHDERFGIKGKEAFYSCENPPEMSKTMIMNEKDLKLAKEYYSSKMFDTRNYSYSERKHYEKIYQDLRVGYTVKRPVEDGISYLEQEVPVFKNKFDYDVYFPKIDENRVIGDSAKLEAKNNLDKFLKFLQKAESALVNDRLFKYNASEKEVESFNEIQKEKFTTREKIHYAFEIQNESKFQRNEKKITELDYIEKIQNAIEKGKLKSLDYNELLEYKKELLEQTLEKLEKIKKEIVLEADLEKFKEIKSEIENKTETLQKIDYSLKNNIEIEKQNDKIDLSFEKNEK